MKNMIKEDIERINELIRLTEQDNVGQYIDSTYLKTSEQAGISDDETNRLVTKTIQDAMDHNMKLVMIRPEFVGLADQMIKEYDSDLLVGTVIDFPNGDSGLSIKLGQALEAIKNNVDELDFVVNYKAFKDGNLDIIKKEVCEGTKLGIDEDRVVKWIIESAALTSEQVGELTSLIRDIVVDCVGEQKATDVFVKTSTGFYKPEDGGPGGATVDDVSIMSINAGPLKVKASGGIYSREDLEKMVDAGASRIGTSAGLEIIKGEISDTDY